LIIGLVRPQFHSRYRQPLIDIAPTNDGPPIVQKYFDWPPVRDPTEDSQALFDDAANWMGREVGGSRLTSDDQNESTVRPMANARQPTVKTR
jgi:hypothetical protein